jgi:acyl-CoA synthetase (AMP-forming)/AMP-acid ligase II
LSSINTLGDILERNARACPKATAVLFEDRRYTHADYLSRVQKLAAGLFSLGLRKQERFSVLSMNCPEYLELYAAAQWAGTIINTVNFRLAAPEVSWIVNNAAPKVMVFQEQFTDVINGLRDQLDTVEAFICIGDNVPEWAMSYHQLLNTAVEPQTLERGRADDYAALVYTSGTTGKPKGVLHTNRSLFSVAEIISNECCLSGRTRLLASAPLFHAGASTLCWSANFRGGCIILHKEFDSTAVIKSIEQHRVTAIHMVPTMVEAVMDSPAFNQHDLSSLEMLMYAAAPMPLALLKRAVKAFGPITYNGYGQTEINFITVLSPHQHVLDGDEKQIRRLASVGQPHWQCDVRIISDDGRECSTDEVGEITARAPTAMSGYWSNSAATLETICDGWIRTGDLGYLDDEGYLFLVDRKKDMIITGGENVYSREVEEVIALHPAVREVAVIGVPDAKWGEAVVAAIALKNEESASPDELIMFCKQHIASYKCPKRIEFITTLPRLNTGKINKIDLRNRYSDTPQ